MKNSSTIIVFTKDRPHTLVKTLQGIQCENIPVIVLDDSQALKNRIINKKEIQKYSLVTYHGIREQQEIFKQIKIEENKLRRFTNTLGRKGWNLGYARNYSIILSKSLKLKKVILMDDDIIVENPTHIAQIFKLLNKYDFVGAKVVGMIDDSVIGHIVRELNYPIEEYFSGGFIAFKPNIVKEYFINLYNEDWIWLYFHNANCSTYLHGEVRQLPFDNFRNAKKKAIKQEIGEILVDGVKETFEKNNFSKLKSKKFWSRLLLEKQVYYDDLKVLSLQQNNQKYYNILNVTAKHSSKLKAQMFSKIFIEYFKDRREWVKILSSL